MSTLLADELSRLDSHLALRLRALGFQTERLIELAAPLHANAVLDPASVLRERELRNRMPGHLSPLPSDTLHRMNATDLGRWTAIGEESLARGELAFCLLSGGMATRMGGKVKALVEVLDGTEETFLDFRIRENRLVSERTQTPVPLWLMTSEATSLAIQKKLEAIRAPSHIETFQQNISLRLTPTGNLFYGADERPSIYPTGHGDWVDALHRSGLLYSFLESGGKYIWIANLDNLAATIDPAILGFFIESTAPLLVEVVDRYPGDRGGLPVMRNGQVQIVEQFRLPASFPSSSIPVFNTNTFLLQVDPLRRAAFNWHWVEVEKQVDDRPAIQFERLLQDITESLPPLCLHFPREGEASRFLPIKDESDRIRQQQAILSLLQARGLFDTCKKI